MTKKHYIKAAKIASAITCKTWHNIVVESFVELFTEKDSQFDRERFRDACKQEPKK